MLFTRITCTLPRWRPPDGAGYKISYHDLYLQGAWWREFKARIWNNPKIPKLCKVCTTPLKNWTVNFHHRHYGCLGHETFNRDVIMICNNCHKKIHFSRYLLFTVKTPLTFRSLYRRELYLRTKHTLLSFFTATGEQILGGAKRIKYVQKHH